MAFRLEGDRLTDAELEHGCVRAHLLEELQPRDDAVVEIDELGFGQRVDVDCH